MTKKTKTENTAAEVAASQTNHNAENGVTTTDSNNMEMLTNPEDVFKSFEANGDPWRDMSSEYMKFQHGETVDIIHTGQSLRDLAGDGSENRVIEATTREGKSIIIGDAVVVSALWDKPTPHPYRLICTGEQKGGRGTYKTFKVLTW